MMSEKTAANHVVANDDSAKLRSAGGMQPNSHDRRLILGGIAVIGPFNHVIEQEEPAYGARTGVQVDRTDGQANISVAKGQVGRAIAVRKLGAVLAIEKAVVFDDRSDAAAHREASVILGVRRRALAERDEAVAHGAEPVIFAQAYNIDTGSKLPELATLLQDADLGLFRK